jgi:hypothetical protein
VVGISLGGFIMKKGKFLLVIAFALALLVTTAGNHTTTNTSQYAWGACWVGKLDLDITG